MEKNNSELYQLISKLDWQINMGVEAMVEEKNNIIKDVGYNCKSCVFCQAENVTIL